MSENETSENETSSQPPSTDFEDETSIFAFSLKYGAIGGLVASAIGLVFFFAGMADHWAGGLVAFAVMIVTMIWAQVSYRQSEQPPVDYGEQLGVAVVTVLYFAVVGAIYSVIYLTVIDPGIVERSMATAAEQLSQAGMTEEQIEAQLATARMMSGPAVAPLVNIVGNVIIGTIIGLISSIFVRKKVES
ncbi:MAG: DUF4199 domain-containing protein [Pseudomonadota bacterium]